MIYSPRIILTDLWFRVRKGGKNLFLMCMEIVLAINSKKFQKSVKFFDGVILACPESLRLQEGFPIRLRRRNDKPTPQLWNRVRYE